MKNNVISMTKVDPITEDESNTCSDTMKPAGQNSGDGGNTMDERFATKEELKTLEAKMDGRFDTMMAKMDGIKSDTERISSGMDDIHNQQANHSSALARLDERTKATAESLSSMKNLILASIIAPVVVAIVAKLLGLV
ncbi:hypothetical protein [Lacticaseibacillus sp. N501-2]|uniref:hypothetical protein n=1 Tax=Lacticaseibacillus salsurae TaxID=3367729 RepID=UPI0038B2B1FA